MTLTDSWVLITGLMAIIYIINERKMEVKELTLNEYQKKAMTTCMESSNNVMYMMMGLCEEVGELQGKFSKGIRKGYLRASDDNNIHPDFSHIEDYDEWVELVKKEAGDVAWMLAGFCQVMGWDMQEVCQMNLDKLAERKKRNVIDGNGDNR